MTKEEAANSICQIIADKGEDGKTMMIGAARMFFQSKHGSAEMFGEGLDYAVKNELVEANAQQVWLK